MNATHLVYISNEHLQSALMALALLSCSVLPPSSLPPSVSLSLFSSLYLCRPLRPPSPCLGKAMRWCRPHAKLVPVSTIFGHAEIPGLLSTTLKAATSTSQGGTELPGLPVLCWAESSSGCQCQAAGRPTPRLDSWCVRVAAHAAGCVLRWAVGEC